MVQKVQRYFIGFSSRLARVAIWTILSGSLSIYTQALSGATISTVAGGGNSDGALALSAPIQSPSSVARDSAGNIYFSDGRSLVRKVTISTGVITTVAGGGSD